MAEKRLDKNKIAPVDVMDNIGDGANKNKKPVNDLITRMQVLIKTAKELKGLLKDVPTGGGSAGGGRKPTTKDLQEFNRLTKEANATAQTKLAIDKELLVEKEKIKQATQAQNKAIKEEVTLAKSQKGSLERLRLESKKLRSEKEQLDLTTRKGNQRLKVINKTLDRNNLILERNATKLGKQKIAIGRYKQALGGLRNALGQLGVAFGVFALIRDSFNVIKDFQQAQANLASVLGVNVDQMKALTEQAKQLGATTRFTASQVSELQLELAKLGFTQQQIQDMTPATLALAEATGTELANAAAVAGATLNGFGLAAKDTQRVVDVMAKSFSSSSLDMEKFKTAMGAVAPVAKTMGFSIEETTAMLGALTDSGLDASTAGTSLRNMMLEASKQGLTWTEALNKVNNAQDKAGVALELFGKRGVAAGVILAENQNKVADLTDTLEDAEGAAALMAKTQRETLGGALDLLRSAWEGLILSMDEAGGVGEILRKVIGFLADNLGTILTVVGKAIRAFIVFKTVMFALKIQQQFKDWKAFGGSVKNLGKNMDKASAGANKFAGSLKSIGIGTAVILFTEFAAALFNIVSGASRAADELLRLQKIRDTGEQQRKDFNKSFKQELKDRKELRQNQIDAAKAQTEIDIKNGISRIKALKTEAEAIKVANKDFLLFLRGRKDPFGRTLIGNLRLQLEGARQNLQLAEQQLKVDKEIANEAVRQASVFRDREKVEQAKNAVKLLVSEITLRRDAVTELNEENESKKEALKITGKGNKETEKQISLLRQIEDIQISLLNVELEREKQLLIVSAQRRIIDTTAKKVNAEELADFISVTNEKLIKDIQALEEAARKEKLEAEMEAARVRRQEVLDIEASFEELKELDAVTTDELFEEREKEKRLGLLKDETLEREDIEREFTEFLIEELEFRLQLEKEAGEDTIDTELKLAELKRKQREKERQEEKEHQKELRDTIEMFGNEVLGGLIDRQKKKQELLDKEISKEQELLDRLREGAKDQNAIASESIAEAEKNIEAKEVQKQKEADIEARLEEAKAIWNSLNNFLDAGDSLPEATIKATTGVFGVRKIIEALPAFFKGTKGRLKDERQADFAGQDGHVVRVDDNEAILTGAKMDQAEAAGMTTTDDIIKSAVMFHQLKGIKEANAVYNQTTVTVDTSALEKKVDNLTKIMKNKKEISFHPHIEQGMANGIVRREKKGSLTNNFIKYGKK